ncbi:hypothetical protein BCR41DRAFT_7921 [Lobosporangium transversale]|uniref:Uncharacterized protein n=1 Tax=Lobosporangium transversale TaxID=64571 RepID=A0A1Y2H2Y9_9FUNG|nr:hypothetical protein BCR41DRAFT_7921 [Lobosporangium transversale]ORZ28895.1 hypothetical protein BCR41DRAFT_7921 [Lobosporangium transversale]|eukprot:XP_021886568.1 hypothetical protein BCR41DRAFT_7921 [Lobosporangium transversale]
MSGEGKMELEELKQYPTAVDAAIAETVTTNNLAAPITSTSAAVAATAATTSEKHSGSVVETSASTVASDKGIVDTLPNNKGKKNKKGKGKDDEAEGKDPAPAEPKKTVSYFSLYRFASNRDLFYITVAIIASIASGVGQPLVALLLGNIVSDLAYSENKEEDVLKNVVIFAIIGAAVFVAAF